MTSSSLDAFLRKWRTAGGAERANAQPFLCDLCELLGVPGPYPADTIAKSFTRARIAEILETLAALGSASRKEHPTVLHNPP